jgi:hypothetical protein
LYKALTVTETTLKTFSVASSKCRLCKDKMHFNVTKNSKKFVHRKLCYTTPQQDGIMPFHSLFHSEREAHTHHYTVRYGSTCDTDVHNAGTFDEAKLLIFPESIVQAVSCDT